MALRTAIVTPRCPQLDDLLVIDNPPGPIWATRPAVRQPVPISNATIISCPPLEPLPPDPLPIVRGGEPYQPRGISNRPIVSPLYDILPDIPPKVTRGATNDVPWQRSPKTISPAALDYPSEDVPYRLQRLWIWIPPQPKVVRIASTEELLPEVALPQSLRVIPRTVPIPRTQTTTRVEDYPADVFPTLSRVTPQVKPWPRPIRMWQDESFLLSEASSAFSLRLVGYRPVPPPKVIQSPVSWDLFAAIFADNVGVTPVVYGGYKEPLANSEGPVLVPFEPPPAGAPGNPPPLVPTQPIQRAVFITPITQVKNFPHC